MKQGCRIENVIAKRCRNDKNHNLLFFYKLTQEKVVNFSLQNTMRNIIKDKPICSIIWSQP